MRIEKFLNKKERKEQFRARFQLNGKEFRPVADSRKELSKIIDEIRVNEHRSKYDLPTAKADVTLRRLITEVIGTYNLKLKNHCRRKTILLQFVDNLPEGYTARELETVDIKTFVESRRKKSKLKPWSVHSLLTIISYKLVILLNLTITDSIKKQSLDLPIGVESLSPSNFYRCLGLSAVFKTLSKALSICRFRAFFLTFGDKNGNDFRRRISRFECDNLHFMASTEPSVKIFCLFHKKIDCLCINPVTNDKALKYRLKSSVGNHQLNNRYESDPAEKAKREAEIKDWQARLEEIKLP
jgi:hypothetical protein